jgi:hypothetical protein
MSRAERMRAGRFRVVLAMTTLLLTTLVAACDASAQRTDTTRVVPQRAIVDTSLRPAVLPPISPRRAFLYSLALPGYGQSILKRPTAGAIFVLAEAIGIAMLRQSNAELQEARRFRSDSLTVIGFDPTSNAPITAAAPYTDELINVRRGHREDWVAALIANHFFAGADAFVAAHLWDLPSQVSVRQTGNGTLLAASLHF